MELVSIKNIKDPICESANFNADIVKGNHIVIHGQSGRRRTDSEGVFSKRFAVGDRAVYHSYNLVYTGVIVSVGKCITIRDEHETRRLSVLQFCRLNWDFDAARIDSHNEAERLCI